MHARELVELAAVLASSTPSLLNDPGRWPDQAMEEYWSASKCRFDRWARAMKQHAARVRSAPSGQARELWQAMRPTLEEILTGEVLTRVFAALCCWHDQGRDESAPIVRNILAGQLEARQRALNLLLYGHGLHVDEAVALNRLRRRNERWIDVLLSLFPRETNAAEFAFHPDRVHDFGGEFRGGPGARLRRSLLLASLRTAYQRGLSLVAANPDMNRQIASAVLACFSPHHFDSTGLLKSLWLERMQRATLDAQGLIADLLAVDDPGMLRGGLRRGDRLDLS